MFVSPTEPFKLIYSLFEHQYLGYLLESFVVELNARGEVTFRTQNVSAKNIKEFISGIDPDDVEIVKLTDSIQQEVVFKKFNTKKMTMAEFFTKVYDPEKGDKLMQEAIQTYVAQRKTQFFSKIKSKSIFIMGSDGVATWKEVEVLQESAKAYFHFERQEEQTVYYPIIKCGDEKVKFQFKGAQIINDIPAALLIDNKLYMFDKYADGKKIKPFLNKPNIIIPKKIEKTYYQKFIVPLVANFNVFAKGFEILQENEAAIPILKITEKSNAEQLDLFGNNASTEEIQAENSLIIELYFKYGNKTFKFDSFAAPANVTLDYHDDNWTFYKIKRDLAFEKYIITTLIDLDLNLLNGRVAKDKYDIIWWIQTNKDALEELGIVIEQSIDNFNNYFIGYANLDLNIEEKQDWFDINAIVEFGEFKIPFVKLRNNILNNIKEFKLPNGQIAVIPEAWFTKYSDLFFNLEIDEDGVIRLNKHHYDIVNNLDQEGLAVTLMNRKLLGLKEFDEIEEVPLPKGFKGKLRPYQKAGYDWLHFLKSFNFGGCLADDMGLGKTVTTLAFLQKLKEDGAEYPSLLVMPTSLIYNWQKEANKFTPKLRILIHFGSNRAKSAEFFKMYDLVICSYGVVRADIDFMKNFQFNYAVLDESQAIKNSSSITFKSVIKLNTKNRLILTGTPLENSTLDLWSQMTFINPGLLGSNAYFKENYQNQIEKTKDNDTLQKLFAKIKPFMLRRHKSQVAKDLPEKIETLVYCQMTEEQEKLYEETKSFVRNQLMNEMGKEGFKKSNIWMLQGLNKLRQLANNPIMINENYEGGSGKDNDVMFKLLSVVDEGYKVLVFSQYVKHLSVIREKLDQSKMEYLYLDGSTKNRQELVDKFQNDKVQIFLISLKAGGVGLNLTAAEYVFMLDPWWNPAIEAQAIDRAHRIGQKNTVFSYKFISKNSIEEKIVELQNHKKRLFDDLITTEESFLKSLTEQDILALME